MEAIPRNRTGHLHAAYKRLSVSPWNSYCKAVLENSCCAALHNHIWSTPDCRTAHVLYHDYDIVPLLANDSSFLHALTWIFWLCPLEGILETTIILQWHASTKRPTARMIFWTSGFVFRSPANSIYGTCIFPWKQVLTQHLQLYCNLCSVVHQTSHWNLSLDSQGTSSRVWQMNKQEVSPICPDFFQFNVCWQEILTTTHIPRQGVEPYYSQILSVALPIMLSWAFLQKWYLG